VSKDILLGLDIDKKKKVYIPKKIRSTHMQVIGSTGTGKSKFLEWMIRNDILNGNGVCLIDPHGYLYDDLVNWLTSYQDFFDTKKIVLFNPTHDDYFLGFNPFLHHSLETSHQVDTMVNACAKAWGAEDMDTTPLLKKCLRCIFHALAETDLTLLESLYFISLSENSINLRSYLIDQIKNPVIKEVWDSFMALSQRDYNQQFSSSANRLIEFLSSERIRRIIGQSKGTIKFKEMMDEGYIVLVNLSSGQRLSRDNSRLLGTLMINDLFLSACERKRVKNQVPKPFYLYIDECAQFLNEDIGRILDECRKFGLHLTLAHQHLAQLRKAGEDIYSSIMTDAKTKIIFGGLTPEDAEILARQIFMGEFDIDEVKHELHSKKVVDYKLRWFNSQSDSSGYSDSETDSQGSSSAYSRGSSRGKGESMPQSSPLFTDDGVLTYSTSDSITSVNSTSLSSARSTGYSESHTDGRSQGLEPVMGSELSSVQFRSLEEQLYRAMAMMVNQPQAHCLVKMPEKTVKAVKVPRVEEGHAIYHPTKDLLAKYESKNFEKYKSQFIALKEDVDREINERQGQLLHVAKILAEKRKEATRSSDELVEPEVKGNKKLESSDDLVE
jgi:hypothetical protein